MDRFCVAVGNAKLKRRLAVVFVPGMAIIDF